MKLRLFNTLVFVGLAVWAAAATRWVAIGFGLIALSQAIFTYAVWRVSDLQRFTGLLLSHLTLGLFGLGFVFALFAGSPETTRFWAVYGAILAVGAPTVLVGRKALSAGKARRPA